MTRLLRHRTSTGTRVPAAAALAAALALAVPVQAQQPVKTVQPTPTLEAAGSAQVAMPAVPPPPQFADSVTLQQAVDLTLQHSPAMAQSQAGVSNATWGKRAAIGGFLPSVSFSSGASDASTSRFNAATNTFVSAGSSQSYTASLSASLDVFTGFRRTSTLSQANAQATAADATLVQQRFTVVQSAKQAFYDVVRNQDLIGVAQTSLEQAQEGLTAAQQRATVGSATKADVLTAQLQVSTAQSSLLTAENNASSAGWALGRLVGASGPVGARAAHLEDPTELSLPDTQIVAMAIARSPSVLAAEATSRASDAATGVARSQYIPSLRLSSGWDWANQNFSLNNGRGSWNLRLTMSYPLFNGFQREQSLAQANNQADVAHAQLEDARRNAEAQVHSLLASLHLAEQQVALGKQSVDVAQQNLQMQTDRYNVGAATILDRITSQLSLVQAQTNLVTARYNYLVARAQLDALVGREL